MCSRLAPPPSQPRRDSDVFPSGEGTREESPGQYDEQQPVPLLPRWQRLTPPADTMSNSNSNGGRRRSLANLGGNMLQSTLAAFVPPKLAHSGSSGEPHAGTAQTVTSARPDTAAQTLAAAKPPRPKRPVDSVSGPTGCVWMWCPAAVRLKPLPSRQLTRAATYLAPISCLRCSAGAAAVRWSRRQRCRQQLSLALPPAWAPLCRGRRAAQRGKSQN